MDLSGDTGWITAKHLHFSPFLHPFCCWLWVVGMLKCPLMHKANSFSADSLILRILNPKAPCLTVVRMFLGTRFRLFMLNESKHDCFIRPRNRSLGVFFFGPNKSLRMGCELLNAFSGEVVSSSVCSLRIQLCSSSVGLFVSTCCQKISPDS